MTRILAAVFYLFLVLGLLEAKPGLLKQEKNEFVYEEETYTPGHTVMTGSYTPWQMSHMSQIQEMAESMRRFYNSMMQGTFYTPLAAYPMGKNGDLF
jgi:phage major head subunit gpT-like protein